MFINEYVKRKFRSKTHLANQISLTKKLTSFTILMYSLHSIERVQNPPNDIMSNWTNIWSFVCHMYTDSTHTCPLFKFYYFSKKPSSHNTTVQAVYNKHWSLSVQTRGGWGRLHTVLTPLAVPRVSCQRWRWKCEKLAAFLLVFVSWSLNWLVNHENMCELTA